ncbi:hypothetical protein E3N88_19612 [Mikania micrantha]|uniref:Uncharacterized protein n=1 Tax=Mikania micrantha TaxID=192012 RepID=A0A5N6NNR6_9ASTR|nr:hypothetical protein E3N88_19612 [Mikania micrantha]
MRGCYVVSRKMRIDARSSKIKHHLSKIDNRRRREGQGREEGRKSPALREKVVEKSIKSWRSRGIEGEGWGEVNMESWRCIRRRLDSLTESCESINWSQSCAIQELEGAVKASTGFNLTCDRFERRRGAVKVPVGLNLE